MRPPITSYNVNLRDQVRRAYLQKGPCQPKDHDFPRRMCGERKRRFNPTWFNEYSSWLEYSIDKDAAYCLCCYLFRLEGQTQGGGDTFISQGFTNWKKKEKFDQHIGGPNSAHNQAQKNCEALLNEKQNIQSVMIKQTDQARQAYRMHLTTALDCTRFLLRQGLAFRGHDESDTSKNQGNFLELMQFLADHNMNIRKVIQEAPGNSKLIAPDIQKDLVNASAVETTNAIINELGDALFSILIDESRDISIKEQMAVVIRFVNNKGQVVERFLSMVHVSDTTALSLKIAIDALFAKHKLSMARLRGQGYDGASNMSGEFNGLKALILRENKYAYYVHCFAHQLQLALVFVAKNQVQVSLLFTLVTSVINIVGASCKRHDQLREKRSAEISAKFQSGELLTGKGLNQESTLRRPGDTRWGSHYASLLNLLVMFSSVVDVLEDVADDGFNSEQRAEASALLDSIQHFDFILTLHMMINILGITEGLSQALQRKEQDIENAMMLVGISKSQLQDMRDNGWDNLYSEVSSFCQKHNINVPNMEDKWEPKGRSRRRLQVVTCLHHYRVEFFFAVIDMQLQELNNRFTVENTDLLLCIGCLNPNDSFKSFDKSRLVHLAELYQSDFSSVDLKILDSQLDTFLRDMHSSTEFLQLKGIGDLAQRMVERRKDILYTLVYRLIKLSLILPVATASVERVFSAMNIIKN